MKCTRVGIVVCLSVLVTWGCEAAEPSAEPLEPVAATASDSVPMPPSGVEEGCEINGGYLCCTSCTDAQCPGQLKGSESPVDPPTFDPEDPPTTPYHESYFVPAGESLVCVLYCVLVEEAEELIAGG